MKSNHKAFFLAFGAIAIIGLVGYFLFIRPRSSSASENLRFVLDKEKVLKDLAGENGMEYEKIKQLYADRNAELILLQNGLISTLGFQLSDRYDVTKLVQPESDFPILRNEIVARIQENYPGFPFDVKFGFPDLIRGDIEMFRDKYIRLAVCERLLQIFGESGIDVVLDFDHPGDINGDTDAKMTITRKIVSVRFEGKMDAIVLALKLLSTPGKYLRVEKMALHSSRSGYSHGCDLQVSLIIVQLEDTGEAPIIVNLPETTNTPPIPSVVPTPAPSAASPTQSPGAPTPKASRPPFGF